MVIVDKGSDGLDGRPRSVAEHAIAETVEATLVHLVDLVDVLLADVAIKVGNEGFDGIGDEGGIVTGVRGGIA